MGLIDDLLKQGYVMQVYYGDGTDTIYIELTHHSKTSLSSAGATMQEAIRNLSIKVLGY